MRIFGRKCWKAKSRFWSISGRPGVAPVGCWGAVIEELATELNGAAKVGKLNVDENPAIAQQFGIRSIPTVLFFDKGQMVDSTIGVVPKDALRSKLEALVSPA